MYSSINICITTSKIVFLLNLSLFLPNIMNYSNNGNNANNATQEDTFYDPYNPNNVQITKKDVEAILNAYHIKPIVHNMTLYRRAFIHESYVRKNV